MSERGQNFIDQWIENNIFAEGYAPEGDDTEARQLAERCLEAAKEEGVSKNEIEEAVGEIVAYLSAAVERVNDEEVERQAAKDD
jgi:20S proteasome alpha/beta subunit